MWKNQTNITKKTLNSSNILITFLPTLIQININTKPKINLSFKRIRHERRHSPRHEEISRSTDYRNLPRLVHQRICPGKVDGALMLRRVEDERKPYPRSEDLLLVVQVESLGPPHGRWVEVVVYSDGVVENDDVPEVVLAGQGDPVAPGRRSHYRGCGVVGVVAVVEYVVEVEDHSLAWPGVGARGGSGWEAEEEEEEEEENGCGG